MGETPPPNDGEMLKRLSGAGTRSGLSVGVLVKYLSEPEDNLLLLDKGKYLREAETLRFEGYFPLLFYPQRIPHERIICSCLHPALRDRRLPKKLSHLISSAHTGVPKTIRWSSC